MVAGTKSHGFEVVDTETMMTQPLLDPDEPTPLSQYTKSLDVYRMGHELLLCYGS
jgi:hypothetical protein